MIVASVNPLPQQPRPGNEMFEFGEMVPHHQGMNETTMVKVHPMTHQPPGTVDISIVPYEGFVQHPYSQNPGQQPPPPHHPPSQLHDAVVLSSSQHPSQPHGTVMPTYMQQQPVAHPAQVQSQDSLLISHYQQSAHPHHDIVMPAPNQQYTPHPPGTVVFASHQNTYHQPHEIVPTQQFVGQPQTAHFPGMLVSPTHQHPPFVPHDGVVHAGQTLTAHQGPYPIHEPLLSPSPHHAGLLHPPVMVNPHMPTSALPGPNPVPAAAQHQYPGQLHGTVVPAYHSQCPGSIQGTVVAGPPPPPPPPPAQHPNGMVHPPHQHTTPLQGAVLPAPQHPNALPGGIIAPYQHQNLHNPMMPSAPHQHPGSLQGTIVSHQHTSPIHSAAVMPTHHHHQLQQQHPAAIFGNLTSHHQYPGSLHQSVVPSSRQHPTSGRMHSNVGLSTSRQQPLLNGIVAPLPLQNQHNSSSKSHNNDSAGSCPSSSSSTISTTSSSTLSKAHDNTRHTATPTTTTTTTTTAAGSHQTLKTSDSVITTTTQAATCTQSKIYSTSTVTSSVSPDSNGQNSSQHVPIKKLGPFTTKSNGSIESRPSHKVGPSSYKDTSTNDSTTGPHSDKITPSTNSNRGPWESRTSHSTINSLKSATVSPSISSTSIESNVTSSERSASVGSQRSLPSRASLLPPRMSLSVNGMLPHTNSMVGKMFGYQHSNGTINNSSVSGRSVSPLSSKKDQVTSPTSNSDIDAITTGLEKSRLHDNQYGGRQLDHNNRRRYVSDSWRRQNSEPAVASYSFSKQQQPLWSSSLSVEQLKRPMYPLKMSKNSYSSAESSKSQPRDTLHLTFFLH